MKFLPAVKNRLATLHLRHVLPDLLVIVASLYLSLFLRVGANGMPEHIGRFTYYLPLVVAIRLALFVAMDVYSIYWRYVSARDAYKLGRAVLVSSGVIIAVSFFISWELGRLPRTVYLIDTALVLMGLMGLRLMRRVRFEREAARQVRDGKRTLIYGAGENGRGLAQRFNSDPGQGINVVGFVDDDPQKQGMSLADVRVLGDRKDLAKLIEHLNISQVIIGIKELPGEITRDIVQITRPFNIKPRICTSWKATDGEPENFVDREIHLSDLLNRPAKSVDLTSIKKLIAGRKVLVTGAGGSIGAEIARQVFQQEPSRLMLLDHSEFNLYEIDRELRLSTADTTRVVPLLIDIKERETLINALKEFRPEVVFHAAAYKHVHLVEANPYSAILNNVTGTKNLLDAAESVDVETFVLISTDKAVNPAGVMGATKRICELMVTALAKKLGKRFCSVRFGNVLGSSGSLIPLLKQQIQSGGPLTITHPDMTRYFMTIPEAVSLVLKAATIARPGDINVLKMGEPVKILDIAKGMLALTGKTEKQVPIIFTGLRPGEKLFEELYIRGDELKTEHPDILTLPDGDTDLEAVLRTPQSLLNSIDQMGSWAQTSDKRAIHQLNELVNSTYVPPSSVKEESEKVSFLIRAKKPSLDN